jgi:hypothetical protein
MGPELHHTEHAMISFFEKFHSVKQTVRQFGTI